MPLAEDPAAVLERLPKVVRRAKTVEDVLTELVSLLTSVVPGLWRATIRRFLPMESQLELIAVWSASGTRLQPGARISAVASSMPEVVRLNRAVFSSEESRARTLVEQVLHTEGIRSWVSIPLHSDNKKAGLLSISSVMEDAIDPVDRFFYEEVGNLVERRLEELLK